MDIFNMFGTLVLTSFDVLAEHDLLRPDSPIPNIGILLLLMIEFLYGIGCDIECNWAHEAVRALDKAGVEIKLRREVCVSQEKIDELRDQYKLKEDKLIEDGKNIYELHAAIKPWSPDDDFEDGRVWAKWDWKKEVGYFPSRCGLP